jgi:hypothetical protein
MSNLQIPSHLILTQKQKEKLHSLPISEFTDVKWTSQNSAISFLKEHNLVLEDIQPENKWKIRCSIKTKGIYILQCCCGSDMGLKKRKSRQIYKFVECLAYVHIKKDKDNNYMSIFGYLKHVEDCQRCLPHQPPPLNLNEMVKRIAQNLLQNHASPSHILDNNANFIANYLNGRVIINNERFLLSNQDLINIRNSMTKDIWGLDKRKAEEINIDEFFGLNSRVYELIEATVYYKPRKELNDRFILVLATKNQRDLAWKFGHQKFLHMDGTFGISNKKILLFTLLVLDDQKRGILIGYLLFSAAGDAQRSSSSYNNSILKELLLHYKNKLEQEKGCEFTPKVIISYLLLFSLFLKMNLFNEFELLGCYNRLRS